ncbi:MAG: DUF2807 domain-containing protein [Planctomycetes bacterium]|nr:DUF2807 domain-containing protein [Planctomycetota bacterium]
MKLSTLIAPLFLGPLCGACVVSLGDDWGADVVGSGVAATETRTIGEFKRIRVHGSTDVVAEVGDRTSLELTADDNLLAYIVTRVDGDTLVIEMKEGSYSSHVPQLARIVSPTLEGFALDGSGDGRFSKLAGARFAVGIAGSGDIVCDGAVDALAVDIAGSGDVDASALAAKRVSVDIAGSGDVSVHAIEDLDVSIAGSGDVVYAGEPRVQQSVAGSGDIRRIH